MAALPWEGAATFTWAILASNPTPVIVCKTNISRWTLPGDMTSMIPSLYKVPITRNHWEKDSFTLKQYLNI
jgi:hypothetical protein